MSIILSDFIRVNFKRGHTSIINKHCLNLHRSSFGDVYASTTDFCVIEESKRDGFSCISELNEITQEEYKRLCEKLGFS